MVWSKDSRLPIISSVVHCLVRFKTLSLWRFYFPKSVMINCFFSLRTLWSVTFSDLLRQFYILVMPFQDVVEGIFDGGSMCVNILSPRVVGNSPQTVERPVLVLWNRNCLTMQEAVDVTCKWKQAIIRWSLLSTSKSRPFLTDASESTCDRNVVNLISRTLLVSWNTTALTFLLAHMWACPSCLLRVRVNVGRHKFYIILIFCRRLGSSRSGSAKEE